MYKTLDNFLDHLYSAYIRKPGPQKHWKFYQILAKAYNQYPELIKNLILKVKHWGYYKDVILILNAARDEELITWIYIILAQQILVDDHNMQAGHKISNLAKWIPKEKSKFDKNLKFVKNITTVLFPYDKRFSSYRKYRKLISNLNQHLKTPEIYILSRRWDEINWKTVPHICLQRHLPTFAKYIPDVLEKELYARYINLSLTGLLKRLNQDNLSEIEKKVLNSVWKSKSHDYYRKIFPDQQKPLTILLDRSQSMFLMPINYFNGYPLLIADHGGDIIINSRNPYKINIDPNLPVSKKLEILKDELESYELLDLDAAVELTDNNLIVLTDHDNYKLTINHPIIYYQLVKDIKPKKEIKGCVTFIKGVHSSKYRDRRWRVIEETIGTQDTKITHTWFAYIVLLILFLSMILPFFC